MLELKVGDDLGGQIHHGGRRREDGSGPPARLHQSAMLTKIGSSEQRRRRLINLIGKPCDRPRPAGLSLRSVDRIETDDRRPLELLQPLYSTRVPAMLSQAPIHLKKLLDSFLAFWASWATHEGWRGSGALVSAS